MAEKPTYPVGVSVLLTNDKYQVLMSKRLATTASGMISTPGGRIEMEGDIYSTAFREFEEETGAKLMGQPYVIGWKEHKRYGMHYFMFYVHAKSYEGTIRNVEPEKHEDWTWFDLQELLKNPDIMTEPPEVIHRVIDALNQDVWSAELAELARKPDSEIDTSDIPEVTDWSKAERGKFLRHEQ